MINHISPTSDAHPGSSDFYNFFTQVIDVAELGVRLKDSTEISYFQRARDPREKLVLEANRGGSCVGDRIRGDERFFFLGNHFAVARDRTPQLSAGQTCHQGGSHVPVLRTREHLVAKPDSGALCTVSFTLTSFSRDLCAPTRTSFPCCRPVAAVWRVCLGGADPFPRLPERSACVCHQTSRPCACEGTRWCSVLRCAVLGPRCEPVSARPDVALPVAARQLGQKMSATPQSDVLFHCNKPITNPREPRR